MPRRLRIEMPDGVYHVTNRGVDRRDVVLDDDDRQEWFRLLRRVAHRCGWRVFAHVLMTNHFHLFLKTPEANLSEGMHDLQSAYATLFNRRHDRSGALYQGRFHAVLVESEGHCWTLSRYIHLNPSRARLAERPEAYPWSTYRYFVDPRGVPEWLDWRTVLEEYSGTESAARVAYRRFVEAGLANPPKNPLNEALQGVLLGSASFLAAHRHLLDDEPAEEFCGAMARSLERVLAVVAQSFDVERGELLTPGRHGNVGRDAAIWVCRQDVRMPLTEIARQFGGISASAVTDAVRRCESRQRRLMEYNACCQEVRRQLREGAKERVSS